MLNDYQDAGRSCGDAQTENAGGRRANVEPYTKEPPPAGTLSSLPAGDGGGRPATRTATSLGTPPAGGNPARKGGGEAVQPRVEPHSSSDRFADPLIAEIVETWRARQDMVRAQQKLQQAPSFSRTQWPEISQSWSQQVYSHYGVQPEAAGGTGSSSSSTSQGKSSSSTTTSDPSKSTSDTEKKSKDKEN